MDEEGGQVSQWLLGKERGCLSPMTFSGKCSSCPLWQMRLHSQLEETIVSLCFHEGVASTWKHPALEHQIEAPYTFLPPHSIPLPSALIMGAFPFSTGVPLPETKGRLPQGFSQAPHQSNALPTPGPDCICASLAGAWHAPPPSPSRSACVACSTATTHWVLHWADLHGTHGADVSRLP